MTISPIVVLTPVRNEAWILEQFLATTTQWADLILIADQGSSDDSREICRKFEAKVEVIDNPSAAYHEGLRQTLLLSAARERLPGRKILIALDADEIIAANGPGSAEWRSMVEAPEGTVLCFEKPDLCEGTEECVRYSSPWPIGYVDDGAVHSASPVHSIRIPTPEGAPRLRLESVKVLHFALVRPGAQQAKARFYSVQENLHGSSTSYSRRARYAPDRDWRDRGTVASIPNDWLAGWEELGIDLHTFRAEKHYWQDFEVLRIFASHGIRRFWLENIWDFDWETCRRAGLERGLTGLPSGPIPSPAIPIRLAGRMLDNLYRFWLASRQAGWSRAR